jgi:hypothetical protein
MKLQYRGAYRNHGLHSIHSSDELRFHTEGRWSGTNNLSVLARKTAEGIELSFDGTANLNRNATYEFKFTMSDHELLELFEMRFGLEASPLNVKKELFGKFLKQRSIASPPSPRIPRLLPPSG